MPGMHPWTPSSRRSGRASLLVSTILCLPGLIILGFAARRAAALREALRTWPRIEAHVDSARVQPWHVATAQAMYAPRFWLTYRVAGRAVRRRLTADYGNDWADAAHAVDDALRRGTVALLVNPGAPDQATLDRGYTASVFAWPLIIAGAGCVVLFIGAGMSTAINPPRLSETGRRAPSRGPALGAGVAGALLVATSLALWSRSRSHRPQWVAASAVVDSADVVQQSSSGRDVVRQLYTPRLWVTYRIDGRAYRRPLLTGVAWTTDQQAVARQATKARWNGPLRIFVDATDPYRATVSPAADDVMTMDVVLGTAGLALLVLARSRWRRTASAVLLSEAP